MIWFSIMKSSVRPPQHSNFASMWFSSFLEILKCSDDHTQLKNALNSLKIYSTAQILNEVQQNVALSESHFWQMQAALMSDCQTLQGFQRN